MEKYQNKIQTSNVINCFFSLKPASTVFPPNCRSKSRYGVTKSLWESLNTSTFAQKKKKSSLWPELSRQDFHFPFS
jgi:hypothetical protein